MLDLQIGKRNATAWRFDVSEAMDCQVSIKGRGEQEYMRPVVAILAFGTDGDARWHDMGPSGNLLARPGEASVKAAGQTISQPANAPQAFGINKTRPVTAPGDQAIQQLMIWTRDLERGNLTIACHDPIRDEPGIGQADWTSNVQNQGISAAGALIDQEFYAADERRMTTSGNGTIAVQLGGDIGGVRGSLGTVDVQWPEGQESLLLGPAHAGADTPVPAHGSWTYEGGPGDYLIRTSLSSTEPSQTLDIAMIAWQ